MKTTTPAAPVQLTRPAHALSAAILLAAAGLSASLAQPPATTPPSGSPPAASPDPAATASASPKPAGDSAPAVAPSANPNPTSIIDARGRRAPTGDPAPLAFKNVPIEQILPFIVEATGKTVIPQRDVLTRTITLLNDQPLPRDRALDLIFLALQQAGVGVVETQDRIVLRDIAEITRQDVPVLGPDTSVLDRNDLGTVVEKVFRLDHAIADNIGGKLKDSLPDFAKYFVDADSNQIVVMGNIALLQRLETLITSLDRQSPISLKTETFRLRYADATQIAININELFSANGAANARPGGQNPQQFQRPGNQRGQQGNQGRPGGNAPTARGSDDASPSANLRVTANVQQNSVSVVGEPTILEQVRRQVLDVWDVPVDEGTQPRIFQLHNTDPIKVRDVLDRLFASSTSSAGRPGGGQNSSVAQSVSRLAGQISVETIPESNSLLVISRSPDNLDLIGKLIEEIDSTAPSAGLPTVVELKHANAEELAEQLNALLAQEGTLASVAKSETGFSTTSGAGASPFASTAQTTTTPTNNQNQTTPANSYSFWWQRARIPTDNAGASNLVSKARIVPVWRQNALMVMAAPEYQNGVVKIIEALDKPGRQVLISAVIAEVSLDDATSLGIRFSNQAISPANGDNVIGANVTSQNAKNDLLPGLFDTSVLNVGANVNLILQALQQKTAINILSEPKIFTSDNQEADFFDGQDIPFITNSQTNTVGNLVQTFDYRAVGIQLRVRPRITVNRDVDLKVDLQLSSIQPNQTLFGGFIVDRRETTTQLIVRDQQTIVISGILRSEDNDVLRKVPILGDVPLLGNIFRSTDKSKTKTELIAFITPMVVQNPEQADDLNKPYKQRLEELRDQLTPEAAPKQQVVPPTPPSTPVNDPAAQTRAGDPAIAPAAKGT